MFDRYLFAEYSGEKEHRNAVDGIRLWRAVGNGAPARLIRANGNNFSRDALREAILDELDEANELDERTIFGLDHQFGWPPHLRTLAGLAGMPWRDAVAALEIGGAGRPALDIPSRFCAAFNNFAFPGGPAVGHIFWCNVGRTAATFGIPNTRLAIFNAGGNAALRYRLTEQYLQAPPAADPLTAPYLPANIDPKPADGVGANGECSVGGQTICGLHHIALMLEREDVAWWPFDGLDMAGDAYEGKHVGVEIYPALYPHAGWPVGGFAVTDVKDKDAWRACRFVQNADRPTLPGRLPGIPPLANLCNLVVRLPGAYSRTQVREEGWILGA
jgi:hypothetical protein